MNLLIDNRWFGNTGIGRYASEIVKRKPENIQISYLNRHWRIKNPLTPWLLGSAINSSKADMFWSPGFMPPANSRLPYVVTVHDLIHLHYGTSLHRLYYHQVIRRLLQSAAYILTDSEFSRDEILMWSGLPSECVRVIPLAVSADFNQYGNIYQPGYPYILYVGNRRIYKNINGMIKAFSLACKNTDIKLVLSGEESLELLDLAKQTGVSNKIIFLGKIEEEDLPSIYRGALAVLYVSLYEGFGLPPLEAMACGAPVLASNVTSLPEVVSNAGIMVDPYDIEAIANAINELVESSELRAELTRRGLERVKQFTWEKSAELTWQVLKS